MYQVTISIISYNQRNLLDRCLTQLRSLRMPPTWHTTVLDNCSTDASAEMVKKKHPWVEQIRYPKNVHYGRGHNIVYARTNSPYFFVLNPDVIVLPGTLDKLLRMFEKYPRAAIVGPCLLNPDGSLQYSGRRYYNWRTVIARRLPISGQQKISDYHLMKDCRQQETRSVDWVLGAAMGIRRAAFPRKDLFDPHYRMYFEDVDLCYFARIEGWDVLYCPSCKMIHDHQRGSAKSFFNNATWFHIVSWLKFYRKTRTYQRQTNQC